MPSALFSRLSFSFLLIWLWMWRISLNGLSSSSGRIAKKYASASLLSSCLLLHLCVANTATHNNDDVTNAESVAVVWIELFSALHLVAINGGRKSYVQRRHTVLYIRQPDIKCTVIAEVHHLMLAMPIKSLTA